MQSKYPKGSEWRRWDLHIHTPKSIVQNFGGETQEAWDSFIQKIASLPPEIKVIGITDYLFCDGYEYLLTRRDEIPNIDLIIPNIEFRLSTFSGTVNNTRRHNFHVLFDPSVSIEDIREQLLGSLSSGYQIQDGTEWQQTPTRRSLEELGKQMKSAAPENNSIQNKTDLAVGFDNITYKREDIEKQLKKIVLKVNLLLLSDTQNGISRVGISRLQKKETSSILQIFVSQAWMIQKKSVRTAKTLSQTNLTVSYYIHQMLMK